MRMDSALISSKRPLSTYALLTRVYLLVVLCVTTTPAAPQHRVGSDGFPIAAEDNFLILNTDDGTYTFAYDTGAGEQQSFRMEVRDASGRVSGRFGYIDPDGALRITNYIADANGYRSTMTVFRRVTQQPKGPALVVGPVPNELPSLDSIALPPGFGSTHRGRPENVLPPDGTPLLIIGPLPRELQPEEDRKNDFPEIIPLRKNEFIEVGEDEFVDPPEVNDGSPDTISNELSLGNSNQSLQFNISLSLAAASKDALLQEDVFIQELQSNSILVSDETNNADVLFELPIQNPISSSAPKVSNVSLLNVDNRLLVDSESQSNALFSNVHNENDIKVENIDIKEVSHLHISTDGMDEDVLSTEKIHIESRTSSKPIKSGQLSDTELNPNTFKLSSRVSGSTKLTQIVHDTIVPVSKNSQGDNSTISEARPDARIEETDFPSHCCDTTDITKASSVQVIFSLPQPYYLPPKSNHSYDKQTEEKKTFGDNSLFDSSNLQSNMQKSEKTTQNSHQNPNNLINMRSSILRAVLLPFSNNSLINLAYLTKRPSSNQRIRSSKFPYLSSKLPKTNFLRKIFFFF